MHNLGWIYISQGNFEQALHWLQKSRSVNPTFASTHLGLGLIYLNLGEFDRANQWFHSAYEIHPDLEPNPMIASILIDLFNNDLNAAETKSKMMQTKIQETIGINIAAGDIALLSGNPTAAGSWYQKALEINPKAWHPFTGVNATTSLGFLLWKTNLQPEAEEMLHYSQKLDQETLAQGSQWWGISYDLAATHAIRGDKSVCYQWLEKAVDEGFRMYTWLSIDPLFESIRGEERYNRIVYTLETQVLTARSATEK